MKDDLFLVLCSKNILMKFVGYQQHTCLCAMMEFVVGTISFSCELYSLPRSCFRSCGIGTFVYGKWCFVSHVQCCGSCMVSTEYSTKQYKCVTASTVACSVGVSSE